MIGAAKRGAAAALLLFAGLHCEPTIQAGRQDAQVLLEKAVHYLMEQQADDGGWHSETHGILRSGQALTPFILWTLLETPDDALAIPDDPLRRGMEFIRRQVRDEGVIGFSDPLLLEYPNYSTAYALRTLAKHGAPGDSARVRRMRSYLIDQQFTESRRIEAGHEAYGGWGFGETKLPDGQVGHVDLSHTRRILQALLDSGTPDTQVFRRAGRFLNRIQQKAGAPESYVDGGFYYSPVVPVANKGGVLAAEEDRWIFRSYATATCDGLIGLLASGSDLDDESVRAAAEWLGRHPNLEYPEGIPHDEPAQWGEAIFYYHLSVRAEAYKLVGWPAGARDKMISLLQDRIREDGSFANPHGAPNKENDPLLATALAVQALLFALE